MRLGALILLVLAALGLAGSAGSAARDYNPNGHNVDAVEGVKWTGTIADFTDSVDPGGFAYKATIDWGDGSGKDTVTATRIEKGSYEIQASHNYAEEGTYQMDVAILGGSGSGHTRPTAHVADAPLTLSMALPGGTTEGGTVNGTVATFKDGNLDEVSGAFTVKLDWGDGTTSAGSVAKTGPGSFSISGSHQYGEEGTPTVKATVLDKGGSTAEGSAALTIADAPLTAGAAVTVRGTEGKAVSGVVATFKDAYAGAPASDYATVTIDWGDSKFTPGTVAPAPGGGWQISGKHAYADEGQYKTSTVVKDKGGATVTIPGFATVVDAPLHAKGARISAAAGQPFKGTVATFTDENPKAAASDFDAAIDWGDGTKSDGKVVKSGNGFTVTGKHTYKKAGRRTVSVRITDRGGAYAGARSRATVSG